MDILNWYSLEYFYNDYEENKEEQLCNSIENKLIYKQDYNLTLEEKELLNNIINSYLSDIDNNHKVSKEFIRKINKLTESKHKIEEKSRNELLAKAKAQTITRYNKAQGYKGFYIYDIDTTNIFNKNSNMLITCKVGDYHSQVEIENTLYWLEYEMEEKNHDLQVASKYVAAALSDAIDGMNIKVNCECRGFPIPYGLYGNEISI